MATVDQKILERAAKLKAMAESAAKVSTQEEAEAFAAMLQKLLLKHKLSMTDIEYASFEKEEPVGEHWIDYGKYPDLNVKSCRSEWVERLASIIARAHFCRFLVHRGSSRITIVGRKSDAEVAEYMLVTLQRLLAKISLKESYRYQAHCFANGLRKEPRFRAAFILAFTQRLAERYHEEKRAQEGESSMALVRLNKADLAVQDYMKRYKNSAAIQGVRSSSREGAARGRAAADAVSLRANAVTSGPTSPKRIG